MNNTILPSELPVNTVIVDWPRDSSMWMQIAPGIWIEMAAKGGFYRVIYNEGAVFENSSKFGPMATVLTDRADSYFRQFQILAAPVGWVHK